MENLLNGFNNGRDITNGVGGNDPITFKVPINYYDDDYDDDYDFDNNDDDDWYERQQDELYERACNCTCGAWQNIKGKTVHVADCCCGAE